MYLNTPLQNYLDDLASAKPTPGGGSAAALTGALGAGLASMVAHLTLSKADYAEVHQEMEMIVQQTERQRARFQQLMQEDMEAYARLSACFKLPRSTAEERTQRTQAIQAHLKEAALVPLEVTELSAELVRYCQRIAEIGNTSVLSDIATGAMLAASAGTGAAWMVRTNLRAMKDLDLMNTLSDRLGTALDTIAAVSQQVMSIVGERA